MRKRAREKGEMGKGKDRVRKWEKKKGRER